MRSLGDKANWLLSNHSFPENWPAFHSPRWAVRSSFSSCALGELEMLGRLVGSASQDGRRVVWPLCMIQVNDGQLPLRNHHQEFSQRVSDHESPVLKMALGVTVA